MAVVVPINIGFGVKVYCPVLGFITIVPVPAVGCDAVYVPPVALISFVLALATTTVFCGVAVASFTATGQLFNVTIAVRVLLPQPNEDVPINV